MKKQMDNLMLDVIAAGKLGYGCHYGRYKADHPHTIRPEQDQTEYIACKYCGKSFPKTRVDKKFCCADCATAYSKRKTKLNRRMAENA